MQRGQFLTALLAAILISCAVVVFLDQRGFFGSQTQEAVLDPPQNMSDVAKPEPDTTKVEKVEREEPQESSRADVDMNDEANTDTSVEDDSDIEADEPTDDDFRNFGRSNSDE